MRVSCAFGSLQDEMLAYTYTSFSQGRGGSKSRACCTQSSVPARAALITLPLIDAAPLANIWPRAQEPQATDLVEDASRAEREERHT